MVVHEMLHDADVLIVTPKGPLDKNDFVKLAEIVDPIIAAQGKLYGLMIYSESFPGWKSIGALINHFRFIKGHHRHIEKVAAVTDSGFLSILAAVAKHFIHPVIRRFAFSDRKNALKWLCNNLDY